MEKKDFAVRKKKLKKTKSTPRRRTNNSSDSVTIESLPIEVLTHLLQYLSPVDRIRSEQVCKKWKNAIRDTWPNIHTLYIISTCNTGYHFRFPGCGEIEENAIHEGKYLFIEGYNLSLVEGLVSRVARKIRKFILDCNGDCYPPGILEIVSKYCRNIEVAELFGVDDCEVEQYREFFKHNKKLHSFKCDNVFNAVEGVPFKNWKSLCLEATDDTDWEFWDDKLVSVIDKSESLEECQVNEISEEVIQAIFKKPCLKSLHYRPRTYHNLEGLKVIFDIAMLNRLTTLSIPNYDLDCNSMSNLLKHCCNLERLGILGSTDEAPPIPVDVILALPKLQTLELNHARIKDDGLIRLTKFKNLLIADQFNYCTDDGFLQVIRTSGSLETLVIHETKVTIGMFKQLATESSERTKYLRITVPFEIYEDALDICKNSKISIVRDLFYSHPD